MLIAAVKGALPMFAVIPGVVLIPLSGVAALNALDLLAHPSMPPFLWPIVVSALVPPLVVSFALWATIAPVRAFLPASVVASVVWIVTATVSVAIMPMTAVRSAVIAHQMELRAQWEAAFARLPGDAPLRDWLALSATADYEQEQKVIDGVKHLERRQSDAEG